MRMGRSSAATHWLLCPFDCLLSVAVIPLLPPLLLLSAGIASSGGLLILQLGLRRTFAIAPQLETAETGTGPIATTSLSVVIPAYNEASNIGPCLDSVLASEPPCESWQVLVVDDESQDATAERARAIAADAASPISTATAAAATLAVH